MIFPFHHVGQFYLWSKEKGQKDKQNNYLQNVTKKTRNLTTPIPQKSGVKFWKGNQFILSNSASDIPLFTPVLYLYCSLNKGNNKITELRTILQRESKNS